jgi:nucleotide-binding universal stress UspA family protein
MFQKILVAIDKGEIGRQVLDAAIALAKCNNASLHLLRVLSYEDEHAPGLKEKGTSEYQLRWSIFEADNQELLEASLATVTDAGLPVETSLIPGKPGRVICDMAKMLSVDTIVLGRRELTGFKELILGSVSNYVVHSAPCSVLVVQERNVH